jgi:hypothetical protein
MIDEVFYSMVLSRELDVHVQASRPDPRRCDRGAAGFGPEATAVWWPTRSKAARVSTRRQASEGRPGRPGRITIGEASNTEERT